MILVVVLTMVAVLAVTLRARMSRAMAPQPVTPSSRERGRR